jgi:serine protease Do
MTTDIKTMDRTKEIVMSGSRRTTFVLAITFVTVAASAPWARAQTRAAAPATAGDLSSTLEATARLVGPSVVQIFTTSYAPGEGLVARTADLVTTQRASGSGVIVDPDGYIVTNAHVVRGSQRLRVELPIATSGRSILATSSRSVGAEVIGIDLETDLAVIKVDEQRLPALAFADSDELKAGQVVLAIGSPLGFSNSVSLGVVSAVARQLGPESPMIYVQTDASINHGSSGGPLVDMRGRLVGINTLILSQTDNYQGFGFAAPSNIARAVYEQIRKSGRVRRGEIGVRAQTVTPVMAAGLRLARDHGAVLADVIPGSPAAQSGLRPGDLVLALDGKPIENGRQFHVGLYRRVAGDIVTVDVLRDGKTVTLPIAMSERSDPLGGLSASIDPRQNLVPRLGILGVAMNPQLAQLLRAQRVPTGVLVASTVAGAIDSRDGGLAAGDIVYAINGAPVAGLAELRAALDVLKMGDAVVLQLERRGELMYLAFTVD